MYLLDMKAAVLLLAFQICWAVSSVKVRPIWNIAHMVNALYQVDEYLNDGANSIETDVSFGSDGEPRWTYHGIPCDCFRNCFKWEYFDRYLDYVRDVASPDNSRFNKDFVLLFLDLKISGLSRSAKYQAGRNVADRLLNIYWKRGTSRARAPVLLSFPNIADMRFVDGFRDHMTQQGFGHYLEKVGWDISNNENLDSIGAAWASVRMSERIWQGDGISNCLPRWSNRLREAVRRRDAVHNTAVHKVYYWTLDRQSTMRQTLRMGVDGMITNHPKRLSAVLKEEEFSGKMRLATIDDDPWEMIPNQKLSYLARLTAEEDQLLINCDNATSEEDISDPRIWGLYGSFGQRGISQGKESP